jgi:hypothetical protein
MDTTGSASWDIVTMKDLSISGMLFNYAKKIPVGEMLELNISLPTSPESIHCIGQVCRVDERQAHKISTAQISIYFIAVVFKDMDAVKQEAIKKICNGYQ